MKSALTPLLLTLSTLAIASPEPLTLENKQGYERRTVIGEMADTLWQNQRFTVNRGMEILQGMSGSDRYYATRTLLGDNRHQRNLLPNRMTVGEMHQLLEESGDQRGALIQLLSDQGIPAAYLSAMEVESLLAPLPPIDYDRALRTLLGDNRMERNYSLPDFKPQEVDNLLKRADDRAGMIRYLADRTLLAAELTLTDAEQIMQQQSTMDRHDSIKALLGSNRQQKDYLKLPLAIEETLQLVEGIALKPEMVRYFADHGVYAGNLTATEAEQLLQGIHQTDRFNSLKALLGDNTLQQNYLQHPLSAEEAVSLLENSAYRDEMVGFMSDRRLLATPLSADQALQLLGELRRADRHDALRALLGGNESHHNHLQLPLSAEAATTLMEEAAYRDELIQWMADQQQLQESLDFEDTKMMLQGLVGDSRFHVLNTLLGQNLAKQRYLADTISTDEWIVLLERGANRLQLLQSIHQQTPLMIESGETLNRLLGRLYGSEREQAAQLLTRHSN